MELFSRGVPFINCPLEGTFVYGNPRIFPATELERFPDISARHTRLFSCMRPSSTGTAPAAAQIAGPWRSCGRRQRRQGRPLPRAWWKWRRSSRICTAWRSCERGRSRCFLNIWVRLKWVEDVDTSREREKDIYIYVFISYLYNLMCMYVFTYVHTYIHT